MPVRVKICGITSLEDALVAIVAGADALGFIFFDQSPRYIKPAKAAAIIEKLPPFVTKVGVFVNALIPALLDVANQTRIDALQLHGDEPPQHCASSPGQVIKAFRVKDESSLAALRSYDVAAFLLDSYVAGQLGGTGEKFNWDLAVEAKQFGKPIVLAGGLTPENIGDAVAKVSPYGVDVSSGVELSPGRKDHDKVRRFISRAKLEP